MTANKININEIAAIDPGVDDFLAINSSNKEHEVINFHDFIFYYP